MCAVLCCDVLCRAGVTVLGYVDTAYARKNLTEVKLDIDR